MRRNSIEIKWTSQLAYAIGLISTDGNLSKDKRHINFTSSDIQLINTYKLCLSKNNSITLNSFSERTKKQSYKFQFSDVNFYDFLVKIGLHPNKSLTIDKINVPNKYFRDFLRGHLDGDGSIIYYKDKYNINKNPRYIYDRLFVYFISASEKHIKWLQESIYKLIGVQGSLNKQAWKEKNKTIIYRLKFSTKQAKVILNWIYYKPNLPCLLRKYQIAKPFLSPSSYIISTS